MSVVNAPGIVSAIIGDDRVDHDRHDVSLKGIHIMGTALEILIVMILFSASISWIIVMFITIMIMMKFL